MILAEFKREFDLQLKDIYPKTGIDTFFYLLAEEYLGFKRIDIALHPNHKISSENLTLLNAALNRLQKEEPIQYIIGKTEFYGLSFFVNKHTLIPRPETEELVAWVIQEARSKNRDSLRLLDIGTGSGCIAISLKKELTDTEVTAIDISPEALKTAKKNAQLNQVDIEFIQQDILESHELKGTYDFIISNPPYVRELEKEMMQKNVLDYEPEVALFVEDDNPLIFYHKITKLAKEHLKVEGALFFEINEYLGLKTKEFIERCGFQEVEIKRDIFGKQRMIKATL